MKHGSTSQEHRTIETRPLFFFTAYSVSDIINEDPFEDAVTGF